MNVRVLAAADLSLAVFLFGLVATDLIRVLLACRAPHPEWAMAATEPIPQRQLDVESSAGAS
jgi:hypothetical protein